jgi:hypothetical protein
LASSPFSRGRPEYDGQRSATMLGQDPLDRDTGTNRSPISAEPLSALPELTLLASSPERQFLRAAAANYLWLLAGARQPATQVSSGECVQRADERFISEPAVWRFGRMLNGDHRELVPEWLELATSTGRVLPPHWLPAILTALREPELALARPVLGATTQWLAGRHPEWTFALAPQIPSEEQWNDGSLSERAAALRALHTADPARARSWLERTWETEAPEARAAFVTVLADPPGSAATSQPFYKPFREDSSRKCRTSDFPCWLKRFELPEFAGMRISRVGHSRFLRARP